MQISIWDNGETVWDNGASPWDSAGFLPSIRRMLLISSQNRKLPISTDYRLLRIFLENHILEIEREG